MWRIRFFLFGLFFYPLLAWTGEIETSFYRIHGEPYALKGKLTEIGIEHTACFGKCPAYSFIIRGVQGNGGFDYEGYANTERFGKFTGTVDLNALEVLVKAIQDYGFLKMEDEYTSNVTDHPSVFTMVIKGGKAKIIRNYANKGPEKLREIESLIDRLMLTAKWVRVKDKIDPPRKVSKTKK